MEAALVSALLDGIAAMRRALRDDNASALHIDGALALQQCAQIIERTTLLAGELTAREPRRRASDDRVRPTGRRPALTFRAPPLRTRPSSCACSARSPWR